MLLDARRVARNYTIECDVCIVGAGAAGITLAQEFNGRDHRVLVVESGGLKGSKATQGLYVGQILDPRHHALDRYRIRRFGGTTTVWGGCCAPFDAIDFQARAHVPYSGWPIDKADLDPFYARAHVYCELGSYAYDVSTALPGKPAPTIPGMTTHDVVSDNLLLFSPPTNFGKLYLSALRQSRNVTVCLYGNVLKLIADPPHHVDRAKVASLHGNEFHVRAKVFVLAAGGLETTRLLLLSDDVHSRGMGNAHDLVGRFYMSLLSGDVGEVELRPRGGEVVWNYETTVDGVYCHRRFSIAPARQEADALLNFSAMLDRPPPGDPSHRDGVLSAVFVAKQLGGRGTRSSLREMAAHCVNILGGAGSILRFSTVWARKRLLSARRLPSVMVKGKGNRYALHFDAEQSPNPGSRVLLGESRDDFGLRRLKVDWRFSDFDVDSVVKSSQAIDGALRQTGVGRLVLGPQAIRDRVYEMAHVGSHHLGTTRMSSDPAKGVVDGNCRVHGIGNLYVASSSVFATSSYAPSTLTIVAMAIRLADHLKDLMTGRYEVA